MSDNLLLVYVLLDILQLFVGWFEVIQVVLI